MSGNTAWDRRGEGEMSERCEDEVCLVTLEEGRESIEEVLFMTSGNTV